MYHLSGITRRAGIIAYVPDSSWLMNTTLRENIIFTSNFDERLYKKVIAVCELENDIAKLPAGDLTEIGENSVNISRG